MRKILITGHRGLLGSACVRYFSDKAEVLTTEIDLLDEQRVRGFFMLHRPEQVIHCAAKVGGVKANRDFPVDFMRINLRLQSNVIDAAADFDVEKLVFIGTSCLFPRDAIVPVCEESLMTGRMDPSVEAYSLAKLAGWRLCKAYHEQHGKQFFTVCPSNIYGPNDNYSKSAHVIPALIHRMSKAMPVGTLKVWGDGTAVREFIHADDAASAIAAVLERQISASVLNVGTGIGTTIAELVATLRIVSCFEGEIDWDTSQPTGIPRKTFDVSKLKSLGWEPQIGLAEGLSQTWADYHENLKLRR
tara:strand:- start:13103 stop:14008 length:906 start_codon:yes stop_codon:yes gene_type:complete